MLKKTVGILAHVDAGKTTFAEQILYYGQGIKTRGRVDHKDAFLDSHSIEKDRGITVFASQGIFSYGDSTYYLIDTPGHIDFSSEMERSIGIMDYAIIIINGAEGVQGHTETVWELLREHKVPVFFFINKVDRDTVDVNNVVEDIYSSLTKDIYYIEENFEIDNLTTELIEFIAQREDILFHKYLEEDYDGELWFSSLKTMIKEGEIFPCFSGSALQDLRMEEFLKTFHSLTYTDYSDEGAFSGYIYKIGHDQEGSKISYIKALTGKLKVRDEISYGNVDNRIYEKINQIRKYNGTNFTMVEEVQAGDVFAVAGLTHTVVGQGIGDLHVDSGHFMVPTLKSKVIMSKELNPGIVLKNFKILEAEDPVLNVNWDEDLQEIHVHIMGVIQLEVLKRLVKERFHMDIDFGPCEILYKETIKDGVIGYGHFEPLGHYAEVHLKLEPGARGSGIEFQNRCHTDDLSVGNQNLIKTHIYEKPYRGILTGSPITDLKITLLTGRGDKEHTRGGDFREATSRAIRQGLEQADNILLEPYYSFKIEVELDHMGRVISDIQKLHGEFQVPEIGEKKVIIRGRGPVATFMDYPIELISFTEGKGKIKLSFHGYDICHNADEIVEEKAYDKNADAGFTSNSIFFTKGQGYVVKASEAKDHMHCL